MQKKNKVITTEKFDDGETAFRLVHEEVTVTRRLDFRFKELKEFYQEHITNDADPEDMHIFPSFIHDAFENSGIHKFPHKFSGEVSYTMRYLACEGNQISNNFMPDLGKKVLNLRTRNGKMEVIMRLAMLRAEMEDMTPHSKHKSILKPHVNFIGEIKLRSGDKEDLYINNIKVTRKTVMRASHPKGEYGSAHIIRLGAGYQTFMKTEYEIKGKKK